LSAQLRLVKTAALRKLGVVAFPGVGSGVPLAGEWSLASRWRHEFRSNNPRPPWGSDSALGAPIRRHDDVPPRSLRARGLLPQTRHRRTTGNSIGALAANGRLRPHFNRRVANLNRRMLLSLIEREGQSALHCRVFAGPKRRYAAGLRPGKLLRSRRGGRRMVKGQQHSCRPSTLSLDRITTVQMHASRSKVEMPSQNVSPH
jgi:hypothetical protein